MHPLKIQFHFAIKWPALWIFFTTTSVLFHSITTILFSFLHWKNLFFLEKKCHLMPRSGNGCSLWTLHYRSSEVALQYLMTCVFKSLHAGEALKVATYIINTKSIQLAARPNCVSQRDKQCWSESKKVWVRGALVLRCWLVSSSLSSHTSDLMHNRPKGVAKVEAHFAIELQ